MNAITGCGDDGHGHLVACTEITARLEAADRADAEGPGHKACADALRRTAKRIADVHLSELREHDEQ